MLTLFLGRVLYRILMVFMTAKNLTAVSGDDQTSPYIRDPYTVAIFFVLIAYYIIYYSFLIRKGNQLLAKKGRF